MKLEQRIKKVIRLCEDLDKKIIRHVSINILENNLVRIEYCDGYVGFHLLEDNQDLYSLIKILKESQNERSPHIQSHC